MGIYIASRTFVVTSLYVDCLSSQYSSKASNRLVLVTHFGVDFVVANVFEVRSNGLFKKNCASSISPVIYYPSENVFIMMKT